MKICVIADPHLGYKQYGLKEREYDFISAFEYAMDFCRENSIDNVICAGDLFNFVRPDAHVVDKAKELIRGLDVCGIDGNHDPSNNHWLNVIGARTLDSAIQKMGNITISGLNYVTPELFMDALSGFVDQNSGCRIDIFVMHQLMEEFVPINKKNISAAAIADKLLPFGVQYVISGDLHIRPEPIEIKGINFIYPGSMSATSISETQPHEFIILNVRDNKLIEIEDIIKIPERKIISKEIHSEDDILRISEELDKESYQKKPVIMFKYDNNNKQLVTRIRETFSDKALIKLMPIIPSVDNSKIARMIEEGFSRYNALDHLKESITMSYPESSDEYNLITKLLANSDNVNSIVDEYASQLNII